MSNSFRDLIDCSPPGSPVHGISQARIPGVDCHFLLLGNFPAQGSNPCLPSWQADFLPLSHLGSPCISLRMAIILKKGKTKLCVGRNLEKLLCCRKWKRRSRWGKRHGGASETELRITRDPAVPLLRPHSEGWEAETWTDHVCTRVRGSIFHNCQRWRCPWMDEG